MELKFTIEDSGKKSSGGISHREEPREKTIPKCPDCKGNLIPLKAKDSKHFALCDSCGNGYNLNYNPPTLYYTNKKAKEQSVKVKTLKEGDLVITKEFMLEKDLDYLYSIIFKEDSEGNRYRERMIKVVGDIGVENWFKAKGMLTNIGSIWKNRYTGSEEPLKKIDFYLWEHYLPIEMWNDKDMGQKFKYKPEDRLEVIMKICKSVANDNLLNNISDMKKRGDGEDKIIKWLAKEKNSGGSYNDDFDISCSLKGIEVTSPLKETLKWKDVYKIIKDLPFKEREIPKEPTCECGKPRIWDVNIRDKCEECHRNHFLAEFNKAGLNELGYSEEKKKFYSHTTGVQPYDLKFIWKVNISSKIFPTALFPDTIYIVNEYGNHTNTLGVTRGFSEYLIKELKMELQGETDVAKEGYVNPSIKDDGFSSERQSMEFAIFDEEWGVM